MPATDRMSAVCPFHLYLPGCYCCSDHRRMKPIIIIKSNFRKGPPRTLALKNPQCLWNLCGVHALMPYSKRLQREGRTPLKSVCETMIGRGREVCFSLHPYVMPLGLWREVPPLWEVYLSPLRKLFQTDVFWRTHRRFRLFLSGGRTSSMVQGPPQRVPCLHFIGEETQFLYLCWLLVWQYLLRREVIPQTYTV